jgi:histidinol-phosphate aminotransferase
MTLTRRAFMRAVGPGAPSPAMITARGREALEGEFGALEAAIIPPADVDAIKISSNENPMGPGPSAIQAIKDNIDQSNRYPMNSRIKDRDVRARLAKMYDGAKAENIVMTPGSGEILRNCVRSFCGPTRPLVTGELSYGSPVRTAELFDLPVKKVANSGDLGLDLDKMAGAAIGAGLVFLCNPNNPTGTAHSKRAINDFVRWVSKESPFTYILLDEAYHEYVTDPAYETGADLALKHRNVILGRTFSKAYGMAGLRQGYGVATKQTAAKLRGYKLTFGANILGLAAVSGALDDPDHLKQEVERNTAVRDYTVDFFRSNGYWVTDAQTNFIFVKTGMTAKAFRDECAKHKVAVGRDFPPYEKEYARISLGTMAEMKRATEVFREVLGISATDADSGNNL